ncbi:MAG: alanine racemase, partial [Gammaproteobacteria bacterium]
MTRPAQLVRDASALRHNYRIACERAPGARVYGIVKADAYGNGAGWAAKHLLAEG